MALVLVAILFFLAAAGGGFALARTVGGQPLLPPTSQTHQPSSGVEVPAKPAELVSVSGDASIANGTGGDYRVSVPSGWQKFIAPHSTKVGPTAVVQYLSPDGRQVLRLERLADFYPRGYQTADYITWLKQSLPEESVVFPAEPLNGTNGVQLLYRAPERANPGERQGTTITRSTFLYMLQAGDSLWLLSVTAPAEQETSARTDLFERIAPTLNVSS